MAYINGEFIHEEYDIKIQVLEPTEDEIRYGIPGPLLNIEFPFIEDYNISNLRTISRWMVS